MKFGVNTYFYDKVLLDVVPLDVCSIVLGSLYLYDRDAIFMHKRNEYQIRKYGKTYIIRSCKSKNFKIISKHVKKLLNASKILTLLAVKEEA